ncbi:MAG: UDP-N-acetylglucosamine 2-epimerase (non-hydrolyzing) [candidate division WOR-3 bacterium]|nr:UDP-N-acetylglucosamine 2-epimerase (non-hydrolyzing) [Candidatus Omnitrophota bacterium]
MFIKKKILFIFGTRPEAIKLAPLYWEFKKYYQIFETKVCITAQHRQMLDQVLNFFQIKPDYDLNVMKENQSLSELTANCIIKIEKILNTYKPDLILLQGDTTTALAGALAGFYQKIKIAHIEAGLRSFDKYSPFPEEINRVIISHLADYHFAPTKEAKKNLIKENIKKNIWVVGNTVIDALFLGLNKIENNSNLKTRIENYFLSLGLNFNSSNKIIVVTSHRRESFGEDLQNICEAIKEISLKYKNTKIIYPVHLNPNVKKTVYEFLKGLDNVILTEPLEYPYFIYLVSKSYLILTDSGGIQEEVPSLKKPLLVMRRVTERKEGIEAGTSILVGTSSDNIIEKVSILLENPEEYNKFKFHINPYGDGKASKRIVKILEKIYSE